MFLSRQVLDVLLDLVDRLLQLLEVLGIADIGFGDQGRRFAKDRLALLVELRLAALHDDFRRLERLGVAMDALQLGDVEKVVGAEAVLRLAELGLGRLQIGLNRFEGPIRFAHGGDALVDLGGHALLEVLTRLLPAEIDLLQKDAGRKRHRQERRGQVDEHQSFADGIEHG